MRKIANSKLPFLAIVAVVAVAMVALYMKGHHDGSVGKSLQLSSEAQAAKAKVSPVKARGDRGVYYPNTENLGQRNTRHRLWHRNADTASGAGGRMLSYGTWQR